MADLERCAWKLVNGDKFILGMPAERCGEQATIRVIRPQRKTDLFLCECHLNEFIDAWGLHYNVKVLCPEPVINTLHWSTSKSDELGSPALCNCKNGCKAWGCDK